MSKKIKQNQVAPLSPVKYILTRARTLPVYKCLITKDWQQSGMASVMILRKHVNHRITAGIYLVDLYAKGVKDTHFLFNEPEQHVMDIMNQSNDNLEEITYVLAHNIIYGAVAFADEHGFKPHRDFEITENILEEDTEDVELIDIPFGVDGKPFIMDELDEFDGFYDDDNNHDDEEDLLHDYASLLTMTGVSFF